MVSCLENCTGEPKEPARPYVSAGSIWPLACQPAVFYGPFPEAASAGVEWSRRSRSFRGSGCGRCSLRT